ncbi:MAG: hypothetical protein PWR04_1097 [Anaerophaga sp.]|nr:hypothetical protein [Anaerophaga sp.]
MKIMIFTADGGLRFVAFKFGGQNPQVAKKSRSGVPERLSSKKSAATYSPAFTQYHRR